MALFGWAACAAGRSGGQAAWADGGSPVVGGSPAAGGTFAGGALLGGGGGKGRAALAAFALVGGKVLIFQICKRSTRTSNYVASLCSSGIHGIQHYLYCSTVGTVGESALNFLRKHSYYCS